MIDHQDLHPPIRRFQFQPELIVQSLQKRGPLRVSRDACIGGRRAGRLRCPLQHEIEPAREPGLIQHRATQASERGQRRSQ